MKKKIILIVASIFAVVATIAGVTYAYYSANVNRINESQTVVKTNKLTLTYTGGQEINVTGIVPGDSFTKTFTVENTSNIAVDYNIYLQNITNEFNEDLVYTLSDETGNVIEESVLPVSNEKKYLKANISIDAGVTKSYTLKITFKQSSSDQNNLQGKSFKATLGVDANKVSGLDALMISRENLIVENLEDNELIKTFIITNDNKEEMKYNVKLSDITNDYTQGLNYSVKSNNSVIKTGTINSNDEYILENQTLESKTSKIYELTISTNEIAMNNNIQLLANESKKFSANIKLDNEEIKTWKLAKDENSNGYADIGDLITIGTESFYVISNDNTNIKALAQYNLYIGGKYDGSWSAYGVEATGMQDSTMRGYISGETIRIGSTAFSSNDQKGTNYSDYTGSLAEKYINLYKANLERVGTEISIVSLITKEELESLGCSVSTHKCTESPSFIYDTSYWTKSSYDLESVWYVISDGGFGVTTRCTNTNNFGIRPVITIDTSEI